MSCIRKHTFFTALGHPNQEFWELASVNLQMAFMALVKSSSASWNEVQNSTLSKGIDKACYLAHKCLNATLVYLSYSPLFFHLTCPTWWYNNTINLCRYNHSDTSPSRFHAESLENHNWPTNMSLACELGTGTCVWSLYIPWTMSVFLVCKAFMTKQKMASSRRDLSSLLLCGFPNVEIELVHCIYMCKAIQTA